MRLKKKRHLLLLFSGILVVGCGTARKAESTVLPTSEDIVSEHLTLKDPITLLDDLEKYPEFKEGIERVLYDRIDYDNYDFKELQGISRVAQDDFTAAVFFDSLLVVRQEKVLSMLSEEDLEKVGAFYKNNSSQYDFLHDALKEAYFADIDNLDYYGLKSLHMAFKDTDLDKLVYPRYSSVRNDLVKGIMDELNPFFDTEEEILDAIDEAIRTDLQEYIENGVVGVVSDLSEKVDRGIFKRTFKRQDMDNYSVTEYAKKLVAKYIDEEYISDLIYTRVGGFIQASTDARFEYLSNYCDDAAENGLYYIGGDVGTDSMDLMVENSKAQEIQNLKAFNDATTVTSLALIFTPVGWVGVLVDALDFYNGMTESSKINTMMDQMSESLYVGYSDQVDKYLTGLYNQVNKAREDSKNYITRYFYEVF